MSDALVSSQWPSLRREPLRVLWTTLRRGYGLAWLTIIVAVVAALPIVNLLAFGWLLRAQARVAQTGRFTAGLPPLDLAARIGSMVLGVWMWAVPVRLISGLLTEARFVRGDSGPWGLWIGLGLIATFCGLQIWVSLRRGGRLAVFFRPINNLRWLLRREKSEKAPQVLEAIGGQATLGHDFWLGLGGLLGTAAWIAVPSATLWLVDFAARGGRPGLGLLVFLAGLAMFAMVLSWLPFLQVHFATAGRLRALFEVGHARTLFRRAPIAMGVSVLSLVLHALPLYLLAIAVPPRDALWLVAVSFVVMSFGARTIVAWAYHRARHRDVEAGRAARWMGRILILAAATAYAVGIFGARYVAAEGVGVLIRHHGLAIPVPF